MDGTAEGNFFGSPHHIAGTTDLVLRYIETRPTRAGCSKAGGTNGIFRIWRLNSTRRYYGGSAMDCFGQTIRGLQCSLRDLGQRVAQEFDISGQK